MRKKFCLFGCLILVILICSVTVFSGCSDSTKRYEFVEGPTLSVEYTQYLGYTATVSGCLKNNTSKEYTYACVTFGLFDENGVQIGTALDNINYLQPNGRWSFEAISLGAFDVKPVSAKLVNIDMW
ncbi:uncharacterized protein BN810_00195 [Acidaminococcus sp. CAG:917]|nr:uncharacterized protein BN810_00195 [Acidaminococcus sp. CAG:917]